MLMQRARHEDYVESDTKDTQRVRLEDYVSVSHKRM